MSTIAENETEAGTPTRRATVPALEARLGEPIPVLDHGFIRVVDYMGDDAAIVQAHHLRVQDKEFLDLVKERLEVFEQTNKAHEAKAKE